MNTEQFTYWLNGFVELTAGEMPTKEQWAVIVEHLGLVFHKVTKLVATKELYDPAKQILTEKEEVPQPSAQDEKEQPKKEKATPTGFDKDYWDRITKQMEEWERTQKDINPVAPYQYPPFIPNQPNWPGINPGDWYDPNGFPRIIC